MIELSATNAVKALWVLPMNGAPRQNAVVEIADGKIIRVSAAESQSAIDEATKVKVKDYGKAIIVPGLINLHTHLEYSLLPTFQSGLRLLPWTRALMKAVADWRPEDWMASARLGARQAASHGTSFLVDSSYSGSSASAIAEAGLKGLVGLELFGIDESKAEKAWSLWQEKLGRLIDSAPNALLSAIKNGRLSMTVAPHAPYTVCPALWKLAHTWAIEHRQLILSHLAESNEECSWFLSNQQEMWHHLQFAFSGRRNTPAPSESTVSWKQNGQTPVGHLANHGLLDANLLAAHAVEVSDQDLIRLSSHGVTVAHCPRSNAYLKNGYAPLEKMRAAGIKVGLGSDSLASCQDLDMLAEARAAIAFNKALNPNSTFGARQALECLTLKAANYLNKAHEIGSLEAGKKADLAVFQIDSQVMNSPAASDADPYDLIVYGDSRLLELYVDGKSVFRSDERSQPVAARS